MLPSWRLTKYDPERRSVAGAFLGDDWISVSDIGRSYEGVELTESEYLRVEAAHLDVIVSSYQDAGHPPLLVRGPEWNGLGKLIAGQVLTSAPRENEPVSEARLPVLARTCLREICWCRIETADESYGIHFGYDFYVYLVGVELTPSTHGVARSGGLFLERFESPYRAPPTRIRP